MTPTDASERERFDSQFAESESERNTRLRKRRLERTVMTDDREQLLHDLERGVKPFSYTNPQHRAADMLRADAEKIRALEADAARLRASVFHASKMIAANDDDARRYRAIRQQLNGVGGWVLSIFAENCEGDGEILAGSKADAAIDAALAATQSPRSEAWEDVK